VHAEELRRQLDDGVRMEQALRWADAEAHYRALLDQAGDANPRDIADVRLRHANALLELGRYDEARGAFDAALDAAKAAQDPLLLGRALLGAGVFAASRGDLVRGEDFLLAALDRFDGMRERDGVQGEGWALLNLAAVYGRTKRLDLAFLTFEKARERLFAIENWVGVATAWELQARLRDGLGDEERAARDFHEAMVFYEKEGMAEKVQALRKQLGGRRVV